MLVEGEKVLTVLRVKLRVFDVLMLEPRESALANSVEIWGLSAHKASHRILVERVSKSLLLDIRSVHFRLLDFV